MAVKPETMLAGFGSSGEPEQPSPFLAGLIGRVRGIGPRFAAIAPGRLNIMGGVSDYTGALVLQQPTAAHACVVVQRRSDDAIVISHVDKKSESDSEHNVPLSRIHGGDAGWIQPQEAQAFLNGTQPATLRCAIGTLVEAIRDSVFPPLTGGLALAVGTDVSVPDGQYAAVAAACMVATAGLFNIDLDPSRAALVCQKVENEWLRSPVGSSDACCALMGEPSSLLEVRSDSSRCGNSIPCTDIRIVGIDCGSVESDACERFGSVRAASSMGALLIERIIQHEKKAGLCCGGNLSRISINDYVDRFRDRLPTKIKGKEFLSKITDWTDPFTRVEPDVSYKVRSRTEHHIYENARSHQFVEAVSRGQRVGDVRAMLDAGDLMTASHWSYGQRCGLGHVKTDVLVNAIREHGINKDIYGVKISGRGCGGVVCAMLKPTDRAFGALDDALRAFEAKSGHRACLHDSTAHAGALVRGAFNV